MAEQFYVECDMRGNFLVSDNERHIFLVLYSDEDKKPIRWCGTRSPDYYYFADKIYLINGQESLISHDAEYIKVLKQVCTNTYQGTITLAYEDLTKETL